MTSCALTPARLRELLTYDPASGLFRRAQVVKGSRWMVGEVAGYESRNGYVVIQIDGKNYAAHRLAWLYVHGAWPPCDIDHRNGVRSDNRIDNLRLATRSQNNQNQRAAKSNNHLGLLGVSTTKEGRFKARIQVEGTQVRLGIFDTPEEAHAAYLAAKARMHPYQQIATETAR
jgi:hypothetical protein